MCYHTKVMKVYVSYILYNSPEKSCFIWILWHFKFHIAGKYRKYNFICLTVHDKFLLKLAKCKLTYQRNIHQYITGQASNFDQEDQHIFIFRSAISILSCLCVRVFYVSSTRASQQLVIISHITRVYGAEIYLRPWCYISNERNNQRYILVFVFNFVQEDQHIFIFYHFTVHQSMHIFFM